MRVPLSLFLLMLTVFLLKKKLTLVSQLGVYAHKHNTTYHFTFIWKTWGPGLLRMYYILLRTSLYRKTATYRRHAMPPFHQPLATLVLPLPYHHFIFITQEDRFPKRKPFLFLLCLQLSLLPFSISSPPNSHRESLSQAHIDYSHWTYITSDKFLSLSLSHCLLLCYKCRDLSHNSLFVHHHQHHQDHSKKLLSVIFLIQKHIHFQMWVRPPHTHTATQQEHLYSHVTFYGHPFLLYLLNCSKWNFRIPFRQTQTGTFTASPTTLYQLYILFIISNSISKNIILMLIYYKT